MCRLVEIRTCLEKIRPIDKQMAYQVGVGWGGVRGKGELHPTVCVCVGECVCVCRCVGVCICVCRAPGGGGSGSEHSCAHS